MTSKSARGDGRRAKKETSGGLGWAFETSGGRAFDITLGVPLDQTLFPRISLVARCLLGRQENVSAGVRVTIMPRFRWAVNVTQFSPACGEAGREWAFLLGLLTAVSAAAARTCQSAR